MKLLDRFDSTIYDALFAICGGSTADPVAGRQVADTYAIWRGKPELSGHDYDWLADYWNEHGLMLWRAGGGPGVPYVYGFGWWRGKDKDLFCFRRCSDKEAEKFLSPLHRSVIIAYIMYVSQVWSYRWNRYIKQRFINVK